jgi:hypothetical protein
VQNDDTDDELVEDEYEWNGMEFYNDNNYKID